MAKSVNKYEQKKAAYQAALDEKEKTSKTDSY